MKMRINFNKESGMGLLEIKADFFEESKVSGFKFQGISVQFHARIIFDDDFYVNSKFF